jgi:hypothetical protein
MPNAGTIPAFPGNNILGLTEDTGKSEISKLDESCISDPKSEVAYWTF